MNVPTGDADLGSFASAPSSPVTATTTMKSMKTSPPKLLQKTKTMLPTLQKLPFCI
ncbi:hypothetical protein HK096_009583, partial [Nowakowskiella sp. JEL0078]